jgi:Xaa-Pro aminopeptidase
MFERVAALQKVLREKNLESILVTNPANVFYFTGLGDPIEPGFWLFARQDNFWVITTDFHRAVAQERILKKHLAMTSAKSRRIEKLLSLSGRTSRVAFERESILYHEYEFFKKSLKGKEFAPCSGLVENIRKIKDRKEIQKIKKAVRITDEAFGEILKIVKPGMSEIFVGRKIREAMEDLGADGTAFDSIVASGRNAADLHHDCSQKKIKNGEMVVIDIGARYKGYCADFTRTIFIGKAPLKFKKIYQIVLEVQEKSISRCCAGLPIAAVHPAAKNDFKKYGEEGNFIHALGHGVGIEAHELPHVGSYEGQGNFENGMIVAIEPGLYHNGYGGVRIEDLCLIDGACKPMSNVSKKIIEIL